MDYKKTRIVIACLVVLSSCQLAFSETFHLGESQGWVSVDGKTQCSYMLEAAKLKKLISEGKIDEAGLALAQFRKQYPELDKQDLCCFMEAELLFAKGKWRKAVAKYQDFMDQYPESWLFDAAIEREYSIASAFLSGQKISVLKVIKVSAFEDGVDLVNDIVDRVGYGPVAQRALEMLALSYEDKEDYFSAYDTWAQIYAYWPTGDIGQRAMLGMARAMHSSYKGPKYESESLISAKGYYENYGLRYPDDAQKIDLADVQTQIVEQQAYKQLEIANYYMKTDSPLAAEIYYQYVADNWPDTTAGKLASKQLEIKKIKEEVKPEQAKAPRKGLWRIFDLFDLSLIFG